MGYIERGLVDRSVTAILVVITGGLLTLGVFGEKLCTAYGVTLIWEDGELRSGKLVERSRFTLGGEVK